MMFSETVSVSLVRRKLLIFASETNIADKRIQFSAATSAFARVTIKVPDTTVH